MSTNYPQGQPQGPGWGQQPQQGYNQPQPGWVQPQPPKKGGVGKALGFGCLGFLIVIIAIAVIAGVSSGGKSNNGVGDVTPAASSTASTSTDQSKTAAPKKSAPKLSTVDAFKAFVRKSGTASERDAVSHVRRIQGGDSNNGILDQADIYTTYTGDMMSSDQAHGKLIASMFADFQASRGLNSKNGLVTIYNDNGDMLSNGNY